MDFEVKDLTLAREGRLRIEWAERSMPVLRMIKETYSREKPLKGIRVAACLHVTSETANLMEALKLGGASVRLCASNPLSTQDDVAASLVKDFGVPVFAVKGIDNRGYYDHINRALDHKPVMTMDDGADLVSTTHSKRRELLPSIIGGTEETTTGVIRLRAMARDKVLEHPIIAVNDAMTKHLFDNRYGTGQSTLDGILRSTNVLMAGSTFVVVGYGMCGRGVAMRAKGAGAKVIVCEVDHLKALEAAMDGYEVMTGLEAAVRGDVFVTVTGDKSVLGRAHFMKMKDGAVVANSGHFNVEIDIDALEKMSVSKRRTREFVEEFTLRSGKRINLLADGRLINLSAAEGHPAMVMDMSFANQALSAAYLVEKAKTLENRVYPVPADIDKRIAALKLESMGITIDRLTAAQKKYLAGWQEGT